MFGVILTVLSSICQWWWQRSSSAQLDKTHILRSSSDFRRDIQRRWCDVQVKRLDRLQLHSKDAMDEKLEQLVWIIDSLPHVGYMTMLNMYSKISDFRDVYSFITLSNRWDVRIYDWDAETRENISTRIGPNYLRGVVDKHKVFWGYILFKEERSARDVKYFVDADNSLIEPSRGILLCSQDGILDGRASYEPEAIEFGDAGLREQMLKKDRNRLWLKRPNGIVGSIVGRRMSQFDYEKILDDL